jgi:hypothetical protein
MPRAAEGRSGEGAANEIRAKEVDNHDETRNRAKAQIHAEEARLMETIGMGTNGMETIGAIIAATVPLIILFWVWVVGRELDRQSNRLHEIQTTLEELRARKELDRQSNQLHEIQTTLEELRAWLALVENQRREEADPAPLTHFRFRRWQRAARRV